MGTTASGLQGADNCNCIRLMDLVLASWVFREKGSWYYEQNPLSYSYNRRAWGHPRSGFTE
jgi:hypothetical protein